ncbi:MAG: Rieske 2Fe-2S domain-containing protein [Gammaproteobacteria bacterium]|nr:Rieske 2Fe-2S domain-containing protein [Gammaproteobacteria bacterium]
MLKIQKIINGKFQLDDDNYFFVCLNEKKFAIKDKCPHRGGPLSLGSVCEKSNSIKCPWHDNYLKIKLLVKRSLIGIRINNQVMVYDRIDIT